MLKKWLIAIALSFCICIAGLVYFVDVLVQDACLDAGGAWLGAIDGCAGGNQFVPAKLLSPLSIAIFIGLMLGIASAHIQFVTLAKNIQGFVKEK